MKAKWFFFIVIIVMGVIGFTQIQVSYSQDCKTCITDQEKYALDGCTVVFLG